MEGLRVQVCIIIALIFVIWFVLQQQLRLDRRYRAGRSPDWIKVKNTTSPAMHRAKEAF